MIMVMMMMVVVVVMMMGARMRSRLFKQSFRFWQFDFGSLTCQGLKSTHNTPFCECYIFSNSHLFFGKKKEKSRLRNASRELAVVCASAVSE